MSDIVFLSGKRTPFGTFLGSLSKVSAIDLGVIASKAAIEQAGVSADDIDHVVFGNVMQTSADAIYGARHIGLKSGVPVPTPAVTINRLCGSGFEALAQASQLLRLGEASMVLAGGTENMTQAPHTIRGARAGFKLGGTEMNDYLREVLLDPVAGCEMAITAENLGEKYGITREDADEYGLRSQNAWKNAHDNGYYANELVDVVIPSRRGDITVSVDEHPQLSPLKPEKIAPVLARRPWRVFAQSSEGRYRHRGERVGINDGAGAMVMTTAAIAQSEVSSPSAGSSAQPARG